MRAKLRLVNAIVFLVLALLLSRASADVSWTNAGVDRLWLNSQNWSTSAVPDQSSDIRIEAVSDANGPLIAGGEAHCNKLKLRDGNMFITGGSLHTHYWAGAGSWGGTSATLEINGDGLLICDDIFLVGYAQQGSLVVEDNASVIIASELSIGKTDNVTAGQGHLQLEGGSVRCAVLQIFNDGVMTFGSVDIIAGQLIIDANEVELVNQYVQEGLITAYENNPQAFIEVSYINGHTIVAADGGDALGASDPLPADGAEGSGENITLSWGKGFRAFGHDVYLGTKKENVEAADVNNQLLYVGRFEVNSYTPGDLELNTTYYWRVDEVSDLGVTKGEVWRFVVSDNVIVDNFESYQDSVELNDRWLSNSITFANLSVGDPCHSGAQAMVVDFNTAYQVPAEVKYSFDEPQDWSEHGYSLLACWVKGDELNSAKDVYIKITDSSEQSFSKTCLDEADVVRDIWSLFVLDINNLADFGVDISSVSSITFGVTSPRSFVSVVVDDIQIFSERCPVSEHCEDFDLNCDNQTNFADFAELTSGWLSSYGQAGYNINYDLNQDTAISLPDLEILAANWLAPDFANTQQIDNLSPWTYWISGPIDLPDEMWPLTPETSLNHPVDLSRATTIVLPDLDSNDKDSVALWQATSWILNKIPHAQMITPGEFSTEHENTNLILLGTLEGNPVIAQILWAASIDSNELMEDIVGDGYRITYFEDVVSSPYDVILMLANSRAAAWQTAILLFGSIDNAGDCWQVFDAVYYGRPEAVEHTARIKSSQKYNAEEILPIGVDMWNYPTLSLSSLKRVLKVLRACQMNTVRISASAFQHVEDPAGCVEKILDIGYSENLKMVINVGNEQLDHKPHDLTDEHWKTICGIKDHPALLSWLLYDELGSGDSYKAIADQLAWLQKIDANHPIDTIIASSFISVSETKKEEMRFLRDRGVDIVTMDYYPWGNWVADSNIARWEEKMAAGYEQGIIPWAIIQGHTTVSEAIMPTPEMMRNQTWWCIAGRARGFFYANPCLYNNATNRGFLSLDGRPHEDGRFDEICRLIPMIKKLKHMLIKAEVVSAGDLSLNFEALTGFSESGGHARFMRETEREQDYIILINKDLSSSVMVEFSIDESSRTQYLADVVGESKVLPYLVDQGKCFYRYVVGPGDGVCLAILTVAWNPTPDDEAGEVSGESVELSWDSGLNAQKHNLYISTDYNALAEGNVVPTLVNSISNTFNAGTLEGGQTYYWKVDEVGDANLWQGDIWKFTVGP
jgi:hypothetical protein